MNAGIERHTEENALGWHRKPLKTGPTAPRLRPFALVVDNRAPSPSDAESTAVAQFRRAFMLAQSGETEKALASYDRGFDSLAEVNPPALREEVAVALSQKAYCHGELGQYDEAIATCKAIVRRFRKAEETSLQVEVARALFDKAYWLEQRGQDREAIAAYEEVVWRFSSATDLSLRQLAAQALLAKAAKLYESGDPEAALAAWDVVVREFATARDTPFPEEVACALLNRGGVFGENFWHPEAIAAYDELIERLGPVSDASRLELIGQALFNKHVQLAELGRHEEAIGALDEIVERLGSSKDISLRLDVAQALSHKAYLLLGLHRGAEEILVYDEIARRFLDDSDADLRMAGAGAVFSKALAFWALNRRDEAIWLYDELIARFGLADTPELRAKAAAALFEKSNLLLEEGRKDEAAAGYEEIVSEFATVADPTLLEQARKRRLFCNEDQEFPDALSIGETNSAASDDNRQSDAGPPVAINQGPYGQPPPRKDEGGMSNAHASDEDLLETLRQHGVSARTLRNAAAEMTARALKRKELPPVGLSTVAHVGRVMKAFLEQEGLAIDQAATRLGVSTQQLSRVVNASGALSAGIAVRLEREFGTVAADWLRIQSDYELAQARIRLASSSASEDQHEPIEAQPSPPQKSPRASKKSKTLKLPPLPPGLEWPSEKFGKSPEAYTKDGIIKYLERVWLPLIEAGVAERRIVAQLDPSVISGIATYQRARAGGRRIPPHLRLLSVGEAHAFRALGKRRIGAAPEP